MKYYLFYRGEKYIMYSRSIYNELLRMIEYEDDTTLELFIECSDEIQKEI